MDIMTGGTWYCRFAQDVVEALHREVSLPDTVIARLACSWLDTIRRIRRGEESGRKSASLRRSRARPQFLYQKDRLKTLAIQAWG
jgi:hypothetical protein